MKKAEQICNNTSKKGRIMLKKIRNKAVRCNWKQKGIADEKCIQGWAD
jgi:hypothetical protein